MIASKARERDRSVRVNVLRCMISAMKLYDRSGDEKWLRSAKEFGKKSKLLTDRIEKHDYTEDDECLERAEDIHKRTVALDAERVV